MMPDITSLRGSIKCLPLAKLTWFKVGGYATVFTPCDRSDLIHFLKQTPPTIAVYPLGVGSNVLIRDGGMDSIVVRLNKFSHIAKEGKKIRVGCGVLDRTLAKFALENNVDGFAFLSGIPGTIGGAIAVNAGCYGGEIKDILCSVDGVTRSGEIVTYKSDQLNLSYRNCAVKDVIFTSATFRCTAGNAIAIKKVMEAITNDRERDQPLKARTGGSTFKNPCGQEAPQKAWELIDGIGYRGRCFGGAQVSEKHCNFLINTGNATAKDIETLGEQIRARIKEHFSVELHWEIRIIGIDK